jgi:hypothetical protein
MSTSTKWYLGVVAGIVVVATAIVIQADEPAEFDPDTPEFVVAQYVEAFMADDFSTTDSLLTAAARKQCEDSFYGSRDIQRVRITDTRPDPAGTAIAVAITWDNSDDPFASEFTERDRFVLTDEDGRWLIETTPWSLCGGK